MKSQSGYDTAIKFWAIPNSPAVSFTLKLPALPSECRPGASVMDKRTQQTSGATQCGINGLLWGSKHTHSASAIGEICLSAPKSKALLRLPLHWHSPRWRSERLWRQRRRRGVIMKSLSNKQRWIAAKSVALYLSLCIYTVHLCVCRNRLATRTITSLSRWSLDWIMFQVKAALQNIPGYMCLLLKSKWFELIGATQNKKNLPLLGAQDKIPGCPPRDQCYISGVALLSWVEYDRRSWRIRVTDLITFLRPHVSAVFNQSNVVFSVPQQGSPVFAT